MTRVLLDARLAVRGLGIGTFIDRLLSGFAAHPKVEVERWGARGEWGRRAQLATLARSGPFDLSPRLDPRAHGFGAVHYAGNLGAVFPGANSVLTVHDLMHRRALRPRDRIMGGLLEQCIRRAGRVVAVSGQTADDVRAAFGAGVGPIEVIPHGLRDVPPTAGERAHVLAFGGGSDPRKRVDLMIGAYEMYRSKASQPLPLVVLTRAGLTPSQSTRLNDLGARLVPTATASEVDALMGSAAALIYPSAEEGFGLPLLEAAEVGTPVVMDSAARVAREVVGPHCIQVADPRPERWAEAVAEAIDGGPRYGSLQLPGWDSVAGRYAELYDEVGV